MSTWLRRIPSCTSRWRLSEALCPTTGSRRLAITRARFPSCAPTNCAKWSSATGACSPRSSASFMTWVRTIFWKFPQGILRILTLWELWGRTFAQLIFPQQPSCSDFNCMCCDTSVHVCVWVFSLGKSRYLDKCVGSCCEALCEGRERYWDSPGSVALIINLLLMKSRLMQCRSTANEDIKDEVERHKRNREWDSEWESSTFLRQHQGRINFLLTGCCLSFNHFHYFDIFVFIDFHHR